MPDWTSLLDAMSEEGLPVNRQARPTSIGGGASCDAWQVPATDTEFLFLKTAPAERVGEFKAEAQGLQEIAKSRTLAVPKILGCGVSGPVAWLVLEWLALEPSTDASDRLLGTRLASMHRSLAKQHGWTCDNAIGPTCQINKQTDSWKAFYSEHRLDYQLRLAARYGHTGRLQDLGRNLLLRLDDVFQSHQPQPSLLHGDLWAGNRGACGGQPVVFDPAVYYGDRETDIAMARLFGGFSQAFHDAYEEAWPLPADHQRRLAVYQLYHVLNHLNLFGSSYHDQAVILLDDILGESIQT